MHQGQVMIDPFGHFAAGLFAAEYLPHSQRDIFEDAKPGQQGMVLKHNGPVRAG